MQLTPELIQQYDIEAPRYTSYPTAPIWGTAYTHDTYQKHLDTLGRNKTPLSLYIHIPFCTKRCYYCACNVVIRKPNDKVGDEYLDYIEKEMQLVTDHLGKDHPIHQLHIGGGTPTFLTDLQLTRLRHLIDTYFSLNPSSELAIEVDPRSVDADRIRHLYTIGFNRLSFGIQDFDPTVQKHIGRHQTVAEVADLFNAARDCGFRSINCDLIYGLPSQTLASFKETLNHVVDLHPDRIALYSFAYVPWLYSHQSLMPEEAFPDTQDKLSIFVAARDHFLSHGYTAIAMDHFAKDTDELSVAYTNGTMTRNFMGYTTLATENYIGLGVSAIGYVSQSFCQNVKDIKPYMAALDAKTLPVEKGLELSEDDVIRRWVITTLMCQCRLQKSDVEARFGITFDTYFKKELQALVSCVDEQLVELHPEAVVLTDRGRLFIRNVVRHFDAYLNNQKKPRQFSRTI